MQWFNLDLSFPLTYNGKCVTIVIPDYIVCTYNELSVYIHLKYTTN